MPHVSRIAAPRPAVAVSLTDRRSIVRGLALACGASLGLPIASWAQGGGANPTSDQAATLFRNVRIFDGQSAVLSRPSNLLVRGNKIARISGDAIGTDAGVRVIEGRGRVLMPGLTDMHWHAMLVRPSPAQLETNDIGYSTLQAGAEATATLMRGFTTVRDLGGPSFSLKRAIDDGTVVGPRIYPSGAMVTITGGHGDFRQQVELPRNSDSRPRVEVLGAAAIADNPDEVRLRVREQLMLGASQIKLTAGGGVASPHTPLDVSTFTLEELQAAVQAASNWGVYVCAHAYTSASIQRAVAAGVKCIEHGHLMDEATARLIADRGVWLSTQPFVDLGGAAMLGPEQQAQMREVGAGTDRLYGFVRKYRIKTAFGTDVLFSRALAERQAQGLVDLTRWYTPAETLVMATSTNGQLLTLSGARNPYPGKIGVVEEGALADLLLVEGDPLQDIKLVTDPARNFAVIMKDGQVYKDTGPA